MSRRRGHRRPHLMLQAARRREVGIVVSTAMPVLLASAFAVWRWAGIGPAAGVAGLGLAATALWLATRLRTLDLAWVVRRLDARHPELEDSSDLLIGDPTDLSMLQRLQRARVGSRLEAVDVVDLRRAWPTALLASGAVLAVTVATAALIWPGHRVVETQRAAPRGPDAPASVDETRIPEARIRIVPPAYTGLPERREQALDASAPEQSRLQWSLRFDPQPASAALEFLDGHSVPLQQQGLDWTASITLDQSQLYRVAVEGAPAVDPRMYRLEAIPDQPPRIRVLEPEQNVVYAQPGQTTWTLAFEARDDHGLGPAELVLTLAQGSGELVDFSEIRMPLDGRDLHGAGESPRRHYTTTLEPVGLGFGVGDDLVARLDVTDNRDPEPQRARSASVVLRWPPPSMGDVAGFDGLMQRTMPAYFRSQRQIIIDAEALIAERDGLERSAFVARSNDIGTDQQLLRLRYGQFMGEEAEGGIAGHDHDHDHDHGAGAHEDPPARTPPQPAPRVSNPLFADDFEHGRDDGHDHEQEHEHEHEHEDDHEHTGPADAASTTAGFGGDGQDVIARFGHLHDIPEAATLLDPQTRETLRGALRAMWASEGALRLGEPEAALPHAHEALTLIQQVRQANRIHLARVGLELPPIDESRRLSGDLDDVLDRPDPIAPATDDARGLADLWSALSAWEAGAAPPDFEAGIDWIMTHRDTIEDPLGLVGAIDAVQRDPDCAACIARLRAQLWPALNAPAAGVRPRTALDEAGQAYLRRLRVGGRE